MQEHALRRGQARRTRGADDRRRPDGLRIRVSSGTPRLVSSETLSARTRLSVHSRGKRESRARGLGPRVTRGRTGRVTLRRVGNYPMPPVLDPSLLPAYAAGLGFGYLCGSIPFGLLLTRLAGTGDIRAIGSGNIGATNVLRTGHKGLAAATLIGDALKGTFAVLLAYFHFGRDAFAHELALFTPATAFLGHLFPIWLGFKGGQGVATYIGLLLALAWPIAIAFALIWLAVVALSRYSSLAALLASAATPVALWMIGDQPAAVLFTLLSVLLWIMHRGNIARLVRGTEHKIGASSDG